MAAVGRRAVLLGGAAAVAGWSGLTPGGRPRATAAAALPATAEPPLTSTFFATASIPYRRELTTASDGDLWPAAWADDGALYAANGDGRGFSDQPWSDIVVNRVDGTPATGISGERLAAGDQVAPIWGDPARFNRKPTGLVAVDGDGDGRDELYLAVQDLRHGDGAFDEAPTATIVRSADYGRTWQWDAAPMFTDHVFTTVFFLDFGQSNGGAAALGPENAGYVYAYALDRNWRDSFTGIVADPLDLWLARVPAGAVTDRSAWRFFAGLDGDRPRWSADLDARVTVLHDERRVYPGVVTPDGNSVLSQGCVVYNPALGRYLYLSWTEHTFEFYEAPAPWGPWRLFLHKDFGPYPWWGDDPGSPGPKNGGYATVAPSKFISADGRELWVQANWFVGVGHPPNTYQFSLRRLRLEPYEPTAPANPRDPGRNLARAEPGAVVTDTTSHYGHDAYLADGRTDLGEDSWNGQAKETDWWGYTWPRSLHVNRVVYTSGQIFPDGGWFGGAPRVQVRRDHEWHDVTGLAVDPPYPADATAGPFRTFTFGFDDTWGDGVRLIGPPGGAARFTSVAELEVFYG